LDIEGDLRGGGGSYSSPSTTGGYIRKTSGKRTILKGKSPERVGSKRE